MLSRATLHKTPHLADAREIRRRLIPRPKKKHIQRARAGAGEPSPFLDLVTQVRIRRGTAASVHGGEDAIGHLLDGGPGSPAGVLIRSQRHVGGTEHRRRRRGYR